MEKQEGISTFIGQHADEVNKGMFREKFENTLFDPNRPKNLNIQRELHTLHSALSNIQYHSDKEYSSSLHGRQRQKSEVYRYVRVSPTVPQAPTNLFLPIVR